MDTYKLMPYRRRGYKRKAYKGRMTAKKVTRIAKKAINREIETKAYDDYLSIGTGITSTPVVYPLFNVNANQGGIVQGTADNDRIGLKIKPTQLNIRYQVEYNNAVTNGKQIMRVAIVQYRNDDARTLTALGDFISSADINTTWLWADRTAFRVLHDRTYNLSVTTSSKSVNLKLRPGVIRFKQTSVTYDNGGVYIMIWQDNNVSTNAPIFDSYYRLMYKDA